MTRLLISLAGCLGMGCAVLCPLGRAFGAESPSTPRSPYPKPLREIVAALPKIAVAKVKIETGRAPSLADRQRVEAVRVLMVYRYLCDVPFDGIVVDAECNAAAEAAAELMTRLGRLDHNPPNAGFPEAFYKRAKDGAGHSNLSGGSDMVGAVHSFMNDSDPSNIDRLGHRRWLLNPKLGKTGIGSAARCTAMWVVDSSRKSAPDYEFVAYPARGYMPLSHFKAGHAWSVSLNPASYANPTKDSVKVAVYPLNEKLQKARKPLPLNYFNVNADGFGEGPVIIFRPDGLLLASRARYGVEISGIKTRQGSPAGLQYLVEFIDLSGAKE